MSNFAQGSVQRSPCHTVPRGSLAFRDEHSLLGALFQTVIAFSGTIGTCLAALLQTKVYESTGNTRESLNASWWLLAGFAWLVECHSCSSLPLRPSTPCFELSL